MSASAVGPSAEQATAPRRVASNLSRDQLDALIFRRCASCAGEIRAGAVHSRGGVFCSVECALAVALPGSYPG